MQITLVTVTYGERWMFIEQMIDYIREKPQIEHLIIVTNGLTKENLQKITTGAAADNRILIHSFEENTGSAGGFHKGLEMASKKASDFILLLDDDNIPEEDALEKATECLAATDFDLQRDCLQLYRPSKPGFVKAEKKRNPYAMLGTLNSFMGFNVLDKVAKIYPTTHISTQKAHVAVATYGGMFFHKNLVKVIGLPDKNLFLYADDYEYSYRITKLGGVIYLCKSSVVNDLETSFYNVKRNALQTRFSNARSEETIYYMVRNNVKFEKNFVTNKWLYQLNKSIYLKFLFVLMNLTREQHKFSIIQKAIKDAD